MRSAKEKEGRGANDGLFSKPDRRLLSGPVGGSEGLSPTMLERSAVAVLSVADVLFDGLFFGLNANNPGGIGAGLFFLLARLVCLGLSTLNVGLENKR